jgi:glucose-6-phosphate dehydrogenase assembly protein OpcA
MERRYTNEAKTRLQDKLKLMSKQSITESIVFNKSDKELFSRLHNYRQDKHNAKVLRELIDLGLKQKGY